jgi:prepilin-type N-terminal cleavage/methylation domain-containing protein
MKPPRRARRAGFTLIEMAVAVALLVVVVGNVYMVLADSSKAMNRKSVAVDTEVQARRALDRIALAVIGASRASLWTTLEAPNHSSELNLVTNLGVQDGEPVWSDPQRIELVEGPTNEVTWLENPSQADEKRVVWARNVASFAEGEIPGNGIDDNANGLEDEKGLSFDVDGDSVTIHLTIEKHGPEGQTATRRLSTLVTCRN